MLAEHGQERTAEVGEKLIRRCATAVGAGATVVQFVHDQLSPAATSHRSR
jgi:hypothetical protein